jgi:hypothetical protein
MTPIQCIINFTRLFPPGHAPNICLTTLAQKTTSAAITVIQSFKELQDDGIDTPQKFSSTTNTVLNTKDLINTPLPRILFAANEIRNQRGRCAMSQKLTTFQDSLSNFNNCLQAFSNQYTFLSVEIGLTCKAFNKEKTKLFLQQLQRHETLAYAHAILAEFEKFICTLIDKSTNLSKFTPHFVSSALKLQNHIKELQSKDWKEILLTANEIRKLLLDSELKISSVAFAQFMIHLKPNETLYRKDLRPLEQKLRRFQNCIETYEGLNNIKK